MGGKLGTVSRAIPVQYHIEEDSTFLIGISYVPLVGIIVSLWQDMSLATKIRETKVVKNLVELINVKKTYKEANAGRNLITAALIITGFTLNIFSGFFTFVAIGAHFVLALRNIKIITKNNLIVNELRATGLREGMYVG